MASIGGPAARWLTPLLALLLAACNAGGPVPAPPGQDPAERAAPAQTLVGAEGHPLAVSAWQAREPEAVILGVHGYGDYGPSTFGAAAAHWAERGITTYAYDQRGFGRNPSRGYWPGAGALAADLRAVIRQVRARHPCLPLVVVGHSMGGGVALAAAGPDPGIDGLVLAAPAIWGGAAMNPLHRLGAWLAAAVVPDWRFSGEGLVAIRASDNLETLRALGRDPLYLSPPSARELMGLVRVTDLAERAAPRVSTPALLLLGGKDEIVPPEGAKQVFRRLRGPRETRVYPEGWHLLFRDLQAPQVWDDVADWAGARAAPSAVACAAG